MMKNKIKILVLLSFFIFAIGNQSRAQYVTKKVSTKHQAYTDSLKSIDYNYTFPILGKAAYKNGFDIPYPLGIMSNFVWLDQGIDITNLQLGVQSTNVDLPLTPIDFITFGENRNTSYTFNVRPDVWIFPFLNVYGLFGYGTSTTEVNLATPIELKSVVTQNIRTKGVGVMGAFGIGPIWASVDANWTWNKPELLDDPLLVKVLGIRLGHTIKFKDRPDRNFAIWAGGMRVKMTSETFGQITLIDALPAETWNRTAEIVAQYDAWYAELGPIKKEAVDNSAFPEIINSIDNADGSTIVKYGMDKQVINMWNGVVGAQLQLNKHWIIRTELGLVGDRKSILFSANYRLLGIKKK